MFCGGAGGESYYSAASLNSLPQSMLIQQKPSIGLLRIAKCCDGSTTKILRVRKSLTASHQRTASVTVRHSFWETVALSAFTRRCAKVCVCVCDRERDPAVVHCYSLYYIICGGIRSTSIVYWAFTSFPQSQLSCECVQYVCASICF